MTPTNIGDIMQLKKSFSLLFVFLFGIPLVAADIGDVFATGSELIDYMIRYSQFTSFIILFAILTALFVIGAKKIGSSLGWTGNAPTVLAVTLSLAATFASWLAMDRGALLFSEAFGRFFALIVIAAFMAILGYVFHKSGATLTGYKFLFVPLAILVFYYILDALLPNFRDSFGSALATIIDVIIILSWISLVIGGGIWAWNTFIAPLTGLKAKTPLTAADFAGTKEAIKQKRELVAEEAASKARKEERKVRRDLRQISRKVKEAAQILSSLYKAVATEKAKVITGDWKRWKGELKKLETLKVEIGAYAALTAKVLAETVNLPVPAPEKAELNVYKADLLKETSRMERFVASLTRFVQQIKDTTPAGDQLWQWIIRAISESSTSFQKILTDGEAALALEQKVREDLGRS
ncbi:MAG: hypothetical protein Q8R53_00655 [Nanoarchaeota archaeon]|nr:hypothetical protein [Nanoarchaeota archaeon]